MIYERFSQRWWFLHDDLIRICPKELRWSGGLSFFTSISMDQFHLSAVMTLATSFISEWDEMYIGEVSSKFAKSALWKGHMITVDDELTLFCLFCWSEVHSWKLMEKWQANHERPWCAEHVHGWLHSWTFLCRCQWPFFFAVPTPMRSGWIQCRQLFNSKR